MHQGALGVHSRRACVVALALGLCALPARTSTADGASGWGSPDDVRAGTGRCEGMIEPAGGDGTICTHGPDDFGSERQPRYARTPEGHAVGTRIPCYGSGPYVRVLYIYGGANMLDAPAPDGRRALIREAIGLADEMVHTAGRDTGGNRRVRWRMTAGCKLSIRAVRTDSPELFAARAELLRRGKLGRNEKGLAFAETGPCMGIAQVADDERPGGANVHNQGGFLAIVNTACFIDGLNVSQSAQVTAHELLHTLGAVQDGAPHSTLAGHCYDEWDVMCYQDGGPRDTMRGACTPKMDPEQIDCHKNDYFNVTPKRGTYLREHWNTARNVYLAHRDPPRWDKLARPHATIDGLTNGETVAGSFHLTATATAPSGTDVAGVDFLVNGSVVASDTTDPYGLTIGVNNRPNGQTLKVSAVAYDDYLRYDRSGVKTVVVGNPTVRLTAPRDYLTVSGGSVAWAADASAGAGRSIQDVRLYVNGALKQTDAVPPYGGSIDPRDFVTMPWPDTFEMYVVARDDGGVTRTSGLRRVVVRDPTLRILSPSQYESVTVDSVNLAADALPAPGTGTTIDEVEFFADGASVGTDSTAPYAVAWSPPNGASGVQITAVATDSDGVQVTSDAGGDVSETDLQHGVTVSAPGSSGTLTLSATPALGGDNPTVDDVQFYVDGSWLGSDSTPSSYSLSWDSTSVANGPHVVRARMYVSDDLGWWWVDSAGTSFVVANPQATIEFTQAPTGSFRGIETLTAHVIKPAGHTINDVFFYANGLQIGYWYGTGAYPTIDWDSLNSMMADGPVTLRAVASIYTPEYATYEVSAEREATLRNVFASVTEPDANEAVSGKITLRAKAGSDLSSQVAWVRFYIEGTYVGRDSTYPYTSAWRSGTVADGTRKVQAKVVTFDGRWASSPVVSFRVDNH